jgi:hypothetical protein
LHHNPLRSYSVWGYGAFILPMKEKLYVAVILLLSAIHGFGQQFQKTYRMTDQESAGNIFQTSDGGYIIGCGLTTTNGGYDAGLLRTNADGDTLWIKAYGGWNWDYLRNFVNTSDGGYLLSGQTLSFGAGAWDIYLVRTDANGDTLWTKAIGGSVLDTWGAIQHSNDGGFIILSLNDSSGNTIFNANLIKIDANGNILWNKIYGGNNDDQLTGILPCSDGGFILSGSTKSFGMGDYDTYVIRTDTAGNLLWSKTYGTTGGEGGGRIIECSDGNFLIVNSINSFGAGGWDIYLLKIDTLGNILWTKSYGTASDEVGGDVIECADGGFLIGGTYGIVTSGNRDVMLMKTDSAGNFLWAKKYGGNNIDVGGSLTQTTDGGYIIGASTYSFGAGSYDAYVIKTDAQGNAGGCNTQGLTFTVNTPILTVTNPPTQTYSGNIVASSTNTIITRGATVNTLCYLGNEEISQHEENQVSVYPNPFSSSTTIEIQTKIDGKSDFIIYDQLGREVSKMKIENKTIIFSRGGLSNGVYFYSIQFSSDQAPIRGKMVIQ